MKYVFYEQSQNHTGGFERIRKVSVYASNAAEANRKAIEDHGIYFDGVSKGIDCACCGDRWHRLYDWPPTSSEISAMKVIAI